MNEKERLISVGKIIGFHGVKGEVKVLPLTENLYRFQEIERVFLNRAEKSDHQSRDHVAHIERAFVHKGNIVLNFKEFNDRNEVESLKDYFICIPKEERPELGEGEYYFDEIIGLKVLDEKSDYLGEIIDIKETGSNDVYIVKDEDKEFLLPALKHVIKEIDLEEGVMKVELMEGLID